MDEILIATAQVPFIRGGAEAHAEGLRDALRAEGHEAEIIQIPFKWYPPEKILDHMLACRLLDVTETAGTPVDLLIGLKFPAYLIAHPNKVLWILHQYRTAYELWDHPLSDLIHWPNGAAIRDAIRQADRQILPESKAIFANSGNVARRLKDFCGIDATPLYHPPPHAEQFYCEAAEDYLFFPSRLTRLKRQYLVLEAMARTKRAVRVRFAGSASEPASYDRSSKRWPASQVHAVEWLGEVTEERSAALRSCARISIPARRSYGYVTLEAMLAAKPVITCTDSGGPLEFVRDSMTGLIAEPEPEALALAMDKLWTDRELAKSWGEQGRAVYERMDITWSNVVRRLLS